ncbi:thioesterase family protein [Veronia pacifica]|uniref:Thioesterase n=1 Tax=Veronia pacifica TaxID=1080227 RepID=A0A1C3EEP4_9GAMM|nr:thioesterase family protein [Veronia pacifica]ODA31689.1 hypothetical protein A8L45_15710 [Veronia pacifica]
MNLIFRLIFVVMLRIFKTNRVDAFDKTTLSFRALPTDCDIYFHLTNSRYSSFNDIGRANFLAQVGALSKMLRRNLKFSVNASEFTFIKSIPPLCKFTLETQLLGWDEKYMYFEHKFVSDKGLHCIAHARAVCHTAQGKQIHITELIGTSRYTDTPVLPQAVNKWKALLDVKREDSLMKSGSNSAAA